MLMSRLRTDRHTDGNVKVEQYSAEAESAKKEAKYAQYAHHMMLIMKLMIVTR